jgi:hypothetical protein
VTSHVAVLLPSEDVTVIVAVPAATPVIVPLDVTLTFEESLVAHVTFVFVALEGRTEATSSSVEPTLSVVLDLLSDAPVTLTADEVTVTVQ